MVKTLVIGHRGSGKSSFAKRYAAYMREAGREAVVHDLDAVIATASGMSIQEIFTTKGEQAFRKLEREVFERILRETATEKRDVLVVAGAGFEGELPSGWRCLWIRRPTDSHGRIFTDRPRLNPDLSPLEEYQLRFFERDPRFRQLSHESLTVSEGFAKENLAESHWVLDEIREMGGALTLLAEDFKGLDRTKAWLERRLRMGIGLFELRDDLLTSAQMTVALETLPPDRVLLSYRNRDRIAESSRFQLLHKPKFIDWATNLGSVPEPIVRTKGEGILIFVSIHQRQPGPLEETISIAEKLESDGYLAKLAVRVDNFEELELGEKWRVASPETRTFLPMSPDGRWSWYRLWLKNRSPLNFVREGDGSSPDQPYLLDWVRRSETNDEFAAVLGDPVAHSRSPGEHMELFGESEFDFFQIRMTEEECQSGALAFLQHLGLRYAAVTSPLKECALAMCAKPTEEAQRLKSVNTLLWEGEWIGTNTDFGGFKEALKGAAVEAGFDFNLRPTALWGGGGMRTVIETCLPNAVPFSARTRQPRDPGKVATGWAPEIVVWSVGRSRWRSGGLRWPSDTWRPKVILDLNYSDDSPGREYALRCGARYISGLGLFKKQAELQRKFWRPDVG